MAILELKGITKRFPGVVANDNICISFAKGSIHAILGENGAGKSTLMNILYGIYKVDEGEIILNGKKTVFASSKDAISSGIGMVHQHFMLVPSFTVWQNIILGDRNKSYPLIKKGEEKARIQGVMKKYKIELDLDAETGKLSVGTQQRLEILKALYKGAKILILDEPTSVLTPPEVNELFKMMQTLQSQGCTIIFISHKLNEIMTIAEDISVLRDGKHIKTVKKEDCTTQMLSNLMVGRDVVLKLDKEEAKKGDVVLEVNGVNYSDSKGVKRLKDITFNVKAGEVYGIAGVDGNGQTELAGVISGAIRQTEGAIYLSGKDISGMSPRQRMYSGMSYIPADRCGTGLIPDFTVAENFILNDYELPPYTRNTLLQQKPIGEKADRLIKYYSIKTPSRRVKVQNLSGGNQQKIVVGRELNKKPKLLIVVQPTWGLDISACEFVYKRILEARQAGMAILLISTELEEVKLLSDTLAVMYEGEILGEVDAEKATIQEIGMMMMGTRIN